MGHCIQLPYLAVNLALGYRLAQVFCLVRVVALVCRDSRVECCEWVCWAAWAHCIGQDG